MMMFSCRWLVTKPIVRPSAVPSDNWYLRTLQLARYYSYRLRIPVACELAHRSSSPHLLLGNVSESVSLSV